jgi:hypothetical protein
LEPTLYLFLDALAADPKAASSLERKTHAEHAMLPAETQEGLVLVKGVAVAAN